MMNDEVNKEFSEWFYSDIYSDNVTLCDEVDEKIVKHHDDIESWVKQGFQEGYKIGASVGKEKPQNTLADALLKSGALDAVVVAELESMSEVCFEHLEELHKKPTLTEWQMVDYRDNLRFIKAAIVVLQTYTTSKYDEYQRRVNRYEDAITPF
jgi:hypothetical protein